MNKSRENAIALSAEFHTHKNFHEFRDKFAPVLNGAVGIYEVIDDMAKLIDKWEAANPNGYDFDGTDWYILTEQFAHNVITHSLTDGHLPAVKEMKELFEQSIKEAQE